MHPLHASTFPPPPPPFSDYVMLTWEMIPGSPRFSVLQATKSWVGSGNEAKQSQQPRESGTGGLLYSIFELKQQELHEEESKVEPTCSGSKFHFMQWQMANLQISGCQGLVANNTYNYWLPHVNWPQFSLWKCPDPTFWQGCRVHIVKTRCSPTSELEEHF